MQTLIAILRGVQDELDERTRTAKTGQLAKTLSVAWNYIQSAVNELKEELKNEERDVQGN